jgi:hypothetical protein
MASGMMDMSQMMMTFFTSTTTSLYSNSWTPTSTGQYAGTCIFLILLAVVLRGLVALRCNFVHLWDRKMQRQEIGVLRQMQVDVKGDGGGMGGKRRRPWRINEAAARACLDTVLAGVSYLL